MAFEKIIGHGRRTSRVSIMSQGNIMAAVLSANIISDLGWSIGDRVDVLAGRDKDRGFVALKKTDAVTGRLLRSHGGGAAPITTLPAATLGLKRPAKSTDLPYRIEGDMLVIDVRQFMPANEVKAAA